MKICDYCDKNERHFCELSVRTYMVMLTTMYSPHQRESQEWRMQVDLCDDCAAEVGNAMLNMVGEKLDIPVPQ